MCACKVNDTHHGTSGYATRRCNIFSQRLGGAIFMSTFMHVFLLLKDTWNAFQSQVLSHPKSSLRQCMHVCAYNASYGFVLTEADTQRVGKDLLMDRMIPDMCHLFASKWSRADLAAYNCQHNSCLWGTSPLQQQSSWSWNDCPGTLNNVSLSVQLPLFPTHRECLHLLRSNTVIQHHTEGYNHRASAQLSNLQEKKQKKGSACSIHLLPQM